MDTEAILREKATQYSPEMQRLKKVDLLFDEKKNDGMSDLHEREITAIALFRSLDQNVFKLPATMFFLDQFISLRRSRDRMGRQELVDVLKQKISYISNPYEFENNQQEKKPGIISRMFGFLRGSGGSKQ